MTDTISAEDYNTRTKKDKPPKYGNRRVKEDGYTFDSAAEHRRYCELKLRQEIGEIGEIGVHPGYPIWIDTVRICDYQADFIYFDRVMGRNVIEDVKGVKTAVYRLKKKLVKACYGIDIVEIEA